MSKASICGWDRGWHMRMPVLSLLLWAIPAALSPMPAGAEQVRVLVVMRDSPREPMQPAFVHGFVSGIEAIAARDGLGGHTVGFDFIVDETDYYAARRVPDSLRRATVHAILSALSESGAQETAAHAAGQGIAVLSRVSGSALSQAAPNVFGMAETDAALTAALLDVLVNGAPPDRGCLVATSPRRREALALPFIEAAAAAGVPVTGEVEIDEEALGLRREAEVMPPVAAAIRAAAPSCLFIAAHPRAAAFVVRYLRDSVGSEGIRIGVSHDPQRLWDYIDVLGERGLRNILFGARFHPEAGPLAAEYAAAHGRVRVQGQIAHPDLYLGHAAALVFAAALASVEGAVTPVSLRAALAGLGEVAVPTGRGRAAFDDDRILRSGALVLRLEGREAVLVR